MPIVTDSSSHPGRRFPVRRARRSIIGEPGRAMDYTGANEAGSSTARRESQECGRGGRRPGPRAQVESRRRGPGRWSRGTAPGVRSHRRGPGAPARRSRARGGAGSRRRPAGVPSCPGCGDAPRGRDAADRPGVRGGLRRDDGLGRADPLALCLATGRLGGQRRRPADPPPRILAAGRQRVRPRRADPPGGEHVEPAGDRPAGRADLRPPGLRRALPGRGDRRGDRQRRGPAGTGQRRGVGSDLRGAGGPAGLPGACIAARSRRRCCDSSARTCWGSWRSWRCSAWWCRTSTRRPTWAAWPPASSCGLVLIGPWPVAPGSRRRLAARRLALTAPIVVALAGAAVAVAHRGDDVIPPARRMDDLAEQLAPIIREFIVHPQGPRRIVGLFDGGADAVEREAGRRDHAGPAGAPSATRTRLAPSGPPNPSSGRSATSLTRALDGQIDRAGRAGPVRRRPATLPPSTPPAMRSPRPSRRPATASNTSSATWPGMAWSPGCSRASPVDDGRPSAVRGPIDGDGRDRARRVGPVADRRRRVISSWLGLTGALRLTPAGHGPGRTEPSGRAGSQEGPSS